MSAAEQIPPWGGDHRRLRNLWVIMQHFPAAYFLAVQKVLGHYENFVGTAVEIEQLSNVLGLKVSSGGGRVHWPKNGLISDPDRKNFAEIYGYLERYCSELGFAASLATVRRMLAALTDPRSTYGDFWSHGPELDGRLHDEMRQKTFFTLDSREAELYFSPRKGWEAIVPRYPDATGDIEEASKCFALGRYGAAVFHSLQVVEVGLIGLGQSIGVTDPKSGWTATMNRLSAIIKKGHEARTSFERQHFGFFEQIHGTIEGLKNAWRNKVSHAHGRLALLTSDFTPDIAEEIIFATRGFMRRLATEAPASPDPDA